MDEFGHQALASVFDALGVERLAKLENAAIKEGILTYIRRRLTNGLVEGINNRIRVIARRAQSLRIPLRCSAHRHDLPRMPRNSAQPDTTQAHMKC